MENGKVSIGNDRKLDLAPDGPIFSHFLDPNGDIFHVLAIDQGFGKHWNRFGKHWNRFGKHWNRFGKHWNRSWSLGSGHGPGPWDRGISLVLGTGVWPQPLGHLAPI